MSIFNDVLKTVSSFTLERERIRSGPLGSNGLLNSPDDFQKFDIGVNSNGDTILDRRLVSGVPNSTLFVGAGLLIGLALVTAAVIADG